MTARWLASGPSARLWASYELVLLAYLPGRGLLTPVGVLLANLVGRFAFGAIRKRRQIASKVVRRFIPHTGAKRLYLGLTFNRTLFIATFPAQFGGEDDALLVLCVASRNGVVLLSEGSISRAKQEQGSNCG